MSGYSKIKVVRNEDALDLIQPPQTPEPTETTKKKKSEEINQIIINDDDSNPNTQNEDSSEQGDDQKQRNNGGMFDPKLRRNSSVSSAYALHTAVKRAFSMRRSSSVSESYCRIHDQSVTLSFDEDELDYPTGPRRSVRKKNSSKSGKILKAWKRLFGL